MSSKANLKKASLKTAGHPSGNVVEPKKVHNESAADAYISKVNLDVKLESKMLNLVRSYNEQKLKNVERRVSSRLTKQRITEMYDTLLETGFGRESIESALLQCVPVGGDLVSVLDWLCINTNDDDLPQNFSQVLKIEEQKLRPKFSLEEEVQEKTSPREADAPKKEENKEGNIKDWILKYAEEDSSDDDYDENGVDCSAVQNVKNKGFTKDNARQPQLDDELNDRYLQAVARYFDTKNGPGLEKEEIRDDMEKLLDEIRTMSKSSGFDARNKRLINIDDELKQLSSLSDDDDEGNFDLFNQEELVKDDEEDANINVKIKELVVRDFSYTRQQWTGKSPKQFLNDWLRKHMQDSSVSFEKVDAAGGKWKCRCTLKRPAKKGGDLKLCPTIACHNIKDAEHLASTLLLYQLCKDKQLHRLLPAPYRDVWLEWEKEEKEKVETSSKEKTKPRDEFINQLFASISSTPVTTKTAANNARDEQDFESWESRDEDELSADISSSGTTCQFSRNQKKLVEECQNLMKINKSSEQFEKLKREREDLPVFAHRENIVEMFRHHPVLIVAGETGSGKSTQVPQFILEDLLSSFTPASSPSSPPPFIMCTEPRRISAISLARRVSSELGETGGPGTPRSLCGYQIRSEVRRSARTRLLFCTTGVLLRRMQDDLNLEDVGCVIVDEVHERDLNTDVLLIHLRELLTQSSRRSNLKVVLMSATLDSGKFSEYFQYCPVVSIQGRSHPVEVLHLENILEMTKYKLDIDSQYSLAYEDIVEEESLKVEVSERGVKKQLVETWSREDVYKVDRSGLDPEQFSLTTRNSLTRMNHDIINVDLILESLRWLYSAVDEKIEDKSEVIPGIRGRKGAVLVFLPGLAAIEEMREVLEGDPLFGDSNRFFILPLHSVLSSANQSSVFSVPPAGVTKVVLSTNIAETGITIPDVVYVVDCGREKQKKYIESSRISHLRQVWISQASARQRQGRAGRVQPGVCFRLYTRNQFSNMSPQSVPEIKRLPLQGLCLHIMKCYSKNVQQILAKAIDPPNPSAVSTALSILNEVGACTDTTLTPLGHHLAKLPLDARLGKMLVYAGVLGCLEEASVMVACMTEKSPFQTKLERSSAEGGKSRFDLFNSDQLTTYLAVRKGLQLEGRMERISYCRKNFLKYDVLKDIESTARELRQVISESGLETRLSDILKSQPNLLKSFTSPKQGDLLPNTVTLLKATLVAGLYPNVGKIVVDEKLLGRKKPCEVHMGGSGTTKVACVHSSSVNRKFNGNGWIVFLNKEMQGNQIALCDTTVVSTISLLLFGGSIQVQHHQHVILLDYWMRFKAPAKLGVLIKEMRTMLNEFLYKKLHNPHLDISGEQVLSLLLQLLASGPY